MQSAFDVVLDHLVLADRLEPASAIVAFGGRDPAVARHAAQLWLGGYAPLLVVSGGNPYGDGRAEAVAFASIAHRAGVPPERVIIEPRARHTGDNVVFSLASLAERGHRVDRLLAVSWPPAARRCRETVLWRGGGVGVVSAPAPGLRPGSVPTPRAVKAVLAQLWRLQHYGTHGFIGHQRLPEQVARAGVKLREALSLEPGSARSGLRRGTSVPLAATLTSGRARPSDRSAVPGSVPAPVR
mgnify:CR=1 FL=1